MKAANVLATIGNTPHIRVSKLFPDAEVWIKSERTNPGGSIKDRIALAMIEAAEADGTLQPGGTIVEPTSGNTGIGLAMVAAVKGYKLILVMPESMSLERRRLMLAYGASFASDAARKGHEGRHRSTPPRSSPKRPAPGCRGSSKTRPTSPSMSAPRRRKSSPISPIRRSMRSSPGSAPAAISPASPKR